MNGETSQAPLSARRARTRRALLDAAQALLAEGRTAVSIQEIADRAGVGFGSFYNFFTSKDELFESALADTIEAYGALLQELVADLDGPAEVFAASFRLTGRLQRRMPEQVRVLLHSGVSILERDQGLAPWARRDLRRGVEAGEFDLEDVELGLMAVGGALLGLLQMLDSRPEVDDADVADRFTQRVLRALGMPPERAAEICARPLPELPGLP